MSLAAELLLVEAAARIGGGACVFFSLDGQGSPLLDEGTEPPARIAARPRNGLVTRGGFVAPHDLISVAAEPGACWRLIADGALIVDAEARTLSAAAGALARAWPDPPALLRLRGAPAAAPDWPALRVFFTDGATGDSLAVREDFWEAAPHDAAARHREAAVDQFDALEAAIGGGRRVAGLRFTPAGAEIRLSPLAALTSPDARQIAHALGAGRAVFDAAGECALAAPQFSARPAAVGLTVAGLPPAGPDPTAAAFDAPGWRRETSRVGERWFCRFVPEAARPARTLDIDLAAPHAPDAWIEELWTAAARPRAAWEDWDEAEAQTELEDNW